MILEQNTSDELYSQGWWDDDSPTTFITEGSRSAPLSEKSLTPYLIALSGKDPGKLYPIEGNLVLGRSSEADIHLMERGVSRHHCRISLEAVGVMIEDLGSRNGTFVNDQRIESQELNSGDWIKLGDNTIFKFTYYDDLERSISAQIRDQAYKDFLTGTYSRRFLLESLEREVSFAIRHHRFLSLLLFDIDHFKQVNDRHGHLAGDQVIQHFAQEIHQRVRSEDILGRYGGEEFILVLRDLDQTQARGVAERLRQQIELLEIPIKEVNIQITTSIGVSSLDMVPLEVSSDTEQVVRTLINLADQALYEAKASGRNCVTFAKVPE